MQYLLEHPAAADSAEGIRHWWLPAESQAGEVIVQEALDALAGKGWLLSHGDRSETRIYRLNESRAAELAGSVGNRGEDVNG